MVVQAKKGLNAALGIILIIGMFAGCDNNSIAPSSNTSEYTLAGYFWQDYSPRLYSTQENGVSYTHSLIFFNDGDSVRIRDERSDALGGPPVTSIVSYSTDPASGAVHFRQFIDPSLFRFPVGVNVSGSFTTDTAKLTALLPISTTDVLAGTENGGVMRYSSISGSWTQTELSASAPVIKLVKGRAPSQTIAAITSSDIWISEDDGTTWDRVDSYTYGPIVDVAISKNGSVIVASGKNLHFSTEPYSNWSDLGLSNTISAIGIRSEDFFSILYVGTSSGKLLSFTYQEPGFTFNPLVDIETFSSNSIQRIYTPTSSIFKSVVLTSDVFLYIEVLDVVEPRPFPFIVSSFAPTSIETVALVAMEKSIYITDFVSVLNPLSDIPAGVRGVYDMVYTGSYHMALTDFGAFISNDAGLSWGLSDNGLIGNGDYTGLMLLADNQPVGGTWDAGVIDKGPGASMSAILTSRIEQHLDELRTADGSQSYYDVLMIRYAVENSGVPESGWPFWRIYYSRNVGPVMIEEYDGMQPDPVSRSHLINGPGI
jgi:hypothetical protein